MGKWMNIGSLKLTLKQSVNTQDLRTETERAFMRVIYWAYITLINALSVSVLKSCVLTDCFRVNFNEPIFIHLPILVHLYSLSLIHISEPTRLGMISYAVFCLKKKKTTNKIKQ